MKKNTVINLNEMFGLEDEDIDNTRKGTTEINLSQLVPFSNHPFKLYEGDRLEDMVKSIKEFGIITPLIVRPKDNGKYEILSGHNRANAGKMLEIEKVPVVIKEDLTDEEAMLIVTETNLIQRSFSELTHSEKARILTERHNAIKEQGKRIDLINEIVETILDDYNFKVDLKKSEVLKTYSQGRGLNYDKTYEVLSGKYLNKPKKLKGLKLKPKLVSKYFKEDQTQKEVEEIIESALDLYFSQNIEDV